MDFPRVTQTHRNITHELYGAVMTKDWMKVEEMYKEQPEIHASKITSFHDTALHVAINLGAPERTVLSMLDAIGNTQNVMESLGATNQKDETPLHRAATHGSPAICRRIIDLEHQHGIAQAQQSSAANCNNNEETPLLGLDRQGTGKTNQKLLAAKRNNNGETPLFNAAYNGRKWTFLYLSFVCTRKGMASDPDLWRRNNGDTMLHCTIRREYFELSYLIIHLYRDTIARSVDKNENTPLDILASIPSGFRSATHLTWWNKLHYNYIRVELLKPPPSSTDSSIEIDTRESDLDESLETQGSLRKLKEKHIWCNQILHELVKENSEYEYSDNKEARFVDLSEEMQLLSQDQRATNTSDRHNDVDLVKQNLEYVFNDNEIAPFVDHFGDEKLSGDKNETTIQGDDHHIENNHQGQSWTGKENKSGSNKRRVALLMATKYGLTEVVEKILKRAPVAIFEKTEDRKNIVLVAVQERQTHILNLLMKKHSHLWPSLRKAEDAEGNNALHLAAKLSTQMPWKIPGSFMQLQWEVKWFEYVKENMPTYLIYEANGNGKTPEEIFVEEHKELVKTSNEWLKDTAASYSLIASITATVAFAACTQVPGGNNDNTGKPILQGQPIFKTFNISILIAFCFSITSLASFLTIFSSRKQPQDFKMGLPMKLLFGLSSFFVSIVCILISFCAAHSLESESGIKNRLTPLYTLILLPLIIYAIAQLRLYVLLLKSSVTKLPLPKYVGAAVLM